MPPWQRIFWRLVRTYHLVFAPLAGFALLLAIVFMQPQTTVALGLVILIGGVSLLASLVAAYISTRQIGAALGVVLDAVQHITSGDYDRRVPIQKRFLVEGLVDALDAMQHNLQSRFAELQASRDQLRAVLNSMVEGVIAIDKSQRVMLINHAACRLFLLDEAQAIGRPLFELVRNPRLQQWAGEALQQTEQVGGELTLLAPASRVLWVRAAGLPGESAPGAVMVVSDLSELRRLEGVRQEFVANASHELKTPLASIKACAETLLDGALDDIDHRLSFLNTISEQADRLDRLVSDMMSLTRIESAESKPDLHPVQIEEIATRCLERHRQNAVRREIALAPLPHDGSVWVTADEEALEQIFDNLLDNAIKYTNAGGVVALRWRTLGQECEIEVEDTGIGIPQGQLSRIFERFYRVDRARSRELGGTGLGLSIVKHLVQALGGTLSVSSRLGKGSTFAVRLKLDHAGPDEPAPRDG